jgi:hypothetical protein
MAKDIDKLLDDFESDIDSVGKKEEPENLWGDTLDYIEKYIKGEPSDPDWFNTRYEGRNEHPGQRTMVDGRNINDYRGRFDNVYETPSINLPDYIRCQHITKCNQCGAVFNVTTLQGRVSPDNEPLFNIVWDQFFCVKCGIAYRTSGKIESVEICNGEFRFDRT